MRPDIKLEVIILERDDTGRRMQTTPTEAWFWQKMFPNLYRIA
jgi:hypothetical protein